MENKDKKINIDLVSNEYRSCQDTTQKIESTIWSTSTAIGIGSLAPLIALILTDKIEAIPAMIIGLLITFMSLIWYFMATRWWDIQHTAFLRMKHLEEILGLYQIRYVYYRDGKIDLEPNDTTFKKSFIDELKGHQTTKFHLRGVKKWLRLLPWFILISWGEFCFYLFFLKNCNNVSWTIVFFILPYLILIIFNMVRTRFFECSDYVKKIKGRYTV
ncbi:MAG: hypothetical protein JXD23_08380 [Spirochaetales bacterium]|nr:hypothetical protein [Spirochaetales bacterium]